MLYGKSAFIRKASLFEFSLPLLTRYERQVTFRVFGFFLLDACSLNLDLGTVVTRCRSSCPGSKCLALLPPAVSNLAEKSRLFCWGMDGFVDLHETWQTELPRAVDNILQGRLGYHAKFWKRFRDTKKCFSRGNCRPGVL